MHLENSSCTNHTDDLKISIWHTHLLHCALSQKIKVWWKKWILIDYRSIALFIWRNLNHSMEAVAHIPLFISKKMKCIQQKHLYFIGYFLQGSLLNSWFDFTCIEWTTVEINVEILSAIQYIHLVICIGIK